MAFDARRLKDRLTSLKGLRSPHEQVWKDCFDYSMPHLGAGFYTQATTAAEIQQQKARLLNGTAGEALTTSADGFMGGMTPANKVWFGIDVGHETDEEKAWLADAAFAIWENLHASNFDAEAYDGVLSLLGAGWFALFVDEDDGGGYYTENWPISQCFIGSTRQGGKVDTIYREYPLAAGALVKEHGFDGVSSAVQQMVRAGKVDDTVQVLWAIEPRTDYIAGSRFARHLPFASCKMELGSNHPLEESGFHEFPVVVPRWRRVPGSAYALGPMSDALPDTKSANEVERWEFAAAETVIAPPLKVVDDGVFNPRTIKLGPRKILPCTDVKNIEPLITGAKVEFAQVVVEKLETRIRRALMADLFDKVLSDPTMTATQVNAIMGMIRQRMGPRFGRMQAEWLQPLVERCYGLALRAGVLGMPPRSLMNRSYGVKYLSPLALAQRSDEVAAIEAHELSLATKAAIQPDVLDTYDWDAGARKAAELRGVPQDLIPDPKVVAAKRAARAEAAAEAQQQQVQLEAQAAGAVATAENLATA